MRNLRIIPKPNNPTVLQKILLTQNLHLVLFLMNQAGGLLLSRNLMLTKFNLHLSYSTEENKS